MEPDVIRLYSSSPPPLEEGGTEEEEDDEFSDFTGVPNSVSFTEFETPAALGQLQALNATSPPELISNGRIGGFRGPAVSNGGQEDAPTCKTVGGEDLKKVAEHPRGVYANLSAVSEHGAVDCNGGIGGSEALTNGFVTFDAGGTPPSCRKRRASDGVPNDNDDTFADFAAFSNAGGGVNWENSNHQGAPAQDGDGHQGARLASKRVDNDKDTTGFASLAEASDCLSNGDWGFHEGTRVQRDRDADDAHRDSNAAESLSTEEPPAQNGVDPDGLEVKDKLDNRDSPGSVEDKGGSSEPTEDKGSENETETETSFGRPLSTEALEEFGDFSTTGSVPSPPLQEDMATPADHSQLAEDDEEDFGDFGDFGDTSSFGGYADFDQQGAVPSAAPPDMGNPERATRPDEDEFGDFGAHGQSGKPAQGDDDGAKFVNVPSSDSFADFESAPVDGWQAFGESDSTGEAAGSWAAFSQDQGSTRSEKGDSDYHEGHSGMLTAPPKGISDDWRQDSKTVSLVLRLEKLFLASFPEASAPRFQDDVPSLRSMLDSHARSEQEQKNQATATGALQDVWQKLQDIHSALGLRHQWGGSYSNKALLCSLGIDTRNILFTGQRKQPVIVPMYAASLGMLEPTKEPLKPVSAAEMIASIAQSPSVAAEMNTCPSDAAQESLPPVQFDWSSSGLTNPLDASGGSSLLNLDFFGPVDESPSSLAGSIPGVDPELYELTQAKLEVSGGGSKVADAFARLMSTVEKTNTSTRRVRVQKEENLSEEARRVISTLPNLSFMQAKLVMSDSPVDAPQVMPTPLLGAPVHSVATADF